MNIHTQAYKIRLGLFITGGLTLFVLAIFFIGKQKNLFNPVFKLSAIFYNVGGLQVGNNIRFSGINVGTIDLITIITDSTVRVDMLLKKEVKKFMKSDCSVAVSSEGLIGDKLLIITRGSNDTTVVKEGQMLTAIEPVETDAIIASLSVTATNAAIITDQLAEIMYNVNHGKGTIGRLIKDSTIAANLNQTIVNLKRSSKGLDENMEVAKHNFLFRGFFRKKKKAEEESKKEKLKSKK